MGLGLSGLRLGLAQQLWGTVWSPANLFPTGTEEGLFLDFSDISTLYTDQTFATNISAIGDPVGGVIDKSQGGGLGVEINSDVDFDNSGSWTTDTGWTVTGGQAVAATSGNASCYRADVTIVAGRLYQLECEITDYVSGDFRMYAGSVGFSPAMTANGTYRFKVFAAGTSRISLFTLGAGTGKVNMFSVKELPGNHLIQATSTARPIWTRHPKSGVRNLFDGSDNPYGKLVIDNVARGSLGVDGVLSPAFSAASVQAYCRFVSAFAYAASTQHTFSATLTPQANGRYAWLATYDGTNDYGIMFDLSNGTVVGRRATADPEDDYGIEPSGSGYRVFVTFTSVASPSASVYSAQIGVSSDAALSFQSTFVGDEDVLIEDVQIEASALPTAYQTRVSQYDVTEAGVDDCYGLTFDGVDDYMVTAANLDLSGDDQVFACMGADMTDVATTAWALDTYTAVSTPSFTIKAPMSAGVSSVNTTSSGNGTRVSTAGQSVSAPFVLSAWSDISAPSVIDRLDGASGTAVTDSQGTGNQSSGTLTLAARNSDKTLAFGGTLYGVTLTDYTLDAEQLAALETWTAARTPEVFLWPRDFLGLTGTHDYYIDATLGNDSNDGSDGAPWATLGKIDGIILSAGTTTKVLVRAGTYSSASDNVNVSNNSAAGAELIIAFEPGCVVDGTAANAITPTNGFEFNGTVAWSTIVYGNGVTVQNFAEATAASPNGFSNRDTHTLTVHDAYCDNCDDGFSAHGAATMFTYDCSAINCDKAPFVHVDTATVEHHRCYFEASGTATGYGSGTPSIDIYDCEIIPTAATGVLLSTLGVTFTRCQVGTATNRFQVGTGGTFTDCYINVYADGTAPCTYTRCYGKLSSRVRQPGGAVVQNCVLIGPATGQTHIVYSNFDGGGNCALTFNGNVVATSSFMSVDATNAGYLLGGSATFAGNSLWAGAAYDADLDASLISGTITTDPQIGSADSYLMADYASAAGLAGFGSGDVVERPAAIPRELRDTI